MQKDMDLEEIRSSKNMRRLLIAARTAPQNEAIFERLEKVALLWEQTLLRCLVHKNEPDNIRTLTEEALGVYIDGLTISERIRLLPESSATYREALELRSRIGFYEDDSGSLKDEVSRDPLNQVMKG